MLYNQIIELNKNKNNNFIDNNSKYFSLKNIS